MLRRVDAARHIDETLGNFAANLVKWIILLVALVSVLEIVGTEATSLVAMLRALRHAQRPRSMSVRDEPRRQFG